MEKYSKKIVDWYELNKRNLPWRKDTNPYHVWISEIMLQQTRIEAVINYYHRFMTEIPDIATLAMIEEDKLLKLWEGLGYYNRAKNLKKAAIKIMNEYQGKFPTKYVEIIKLPGIGEYTASAISSICFNESQVTIDGNVLRVYTRFYNDTRNIDDMKTKKEIRDELMRIIPKESGDFNQGLMELGETICLPNGIPKCNICPLAKNCQSRKENNYLAIPVRNPKREKKIETFTVLLFKYQDEFAIYKRTHESLLNNLWSFPMLENSLTISELKNYLEKQQILYKEINLGPKNIHVFTHKKWQMQSFFIEVSTKENLLDYTWIKKFDLENTYAIPTALQPFKQAVIKSMETQK